MTHTSLFLVSLITFALFYLSVNSQSLREGFARDTKDVLTRQLHQILVDRNLKSKSDLLDETDIAKPLTKQPNALLKGNKQRSYTYTKAGTISEGFKMTPLDDYVSRPDNHYQWEELQTYYDEGAYTVHFLNVTSQKWLDEKTVTRSIWWHIVGVVVPTNFTQSENAISYITGSGNPDNGQLPSPRDESILLGSALAIETQTIAVIVWQIPNQRLMFLDEKPTPKSRTEDGIIAYTWNHFLENQNEPDWLLRNPMVKGANRALDAVEDYVEKKWQHQLKKWTICGASKRGWTTWILAAYDQAHEKRVVGFMPMVESFINMRKQFHAWWRSNGGWSFALQDYYLMNFTANFDSPAADKMAEIIDPLSYFERYKNIPVMQIMASGDEFFQLSDTYLYWDQIPGEKHLLICENSEHSLATALLEMIPSMISFHKSLVQNKKRPQVDWKFDRENNKITVETNVPPTSAKVWFAKTFSSKRIDFRVVRLESPDEPCQFPKIQNLCPQPILWLPLKASQVTPFKYEASFSSPESGWAAFFINLQFENQGAGTETFPHIFTTEAIIFPNTEPFPPCEKSGCHGNLI